mmetsp:Transcript_23453/g.54276  ORF Transcript_23453/g.54276 Transcript_23453/m.54276 type:complete len:88 (-) Transcript_23453:181-444(-)
MRLLLLLLMPLPMMHLLLLLLMPLLLLRLLLRLLLLLLFSHLRWLLKKGWYHPWLRVMSLQVLRLLRLLGRGSERDADYRRHASPPQ